MPHPTDEFPWAQLGRWFAGELTPAEATELERWVASDPERATVVAALREAWKHAGTPGQGWDAGRALQRVHEAAAAEARVIARLGAARPAVAPSRWRRALPVLRVAAVLALVVGGTFLAERAIRRPSAAKSAPAVAEYRTAPGQRLSLRLGDGTQVLLAPGSVLRRPLDYGARERRLELQGQAYFVVTHDSTHPFTVQTRDLAARDLGTRFDVRAYVDEGSTEVVVAEGKVAVSSGRTNGRGALLVTGQLARASSGDGIAVRSNVDLGRRLAWTEGRLVFSDTPLREVQRQLARWYDVDVRLGSPVLGGLRVSGAFGDEPVTQVLDAVARSLGLVVRRAGAAYELTRSDR